MQAEPFFATLRRILDPQECPIVVGALRQDDKVWKALSDPAVFQQCQNTIGSHAAGWNPAAVGLCLLPEAPKPSRLQGQPMEGIPGDLRKSAARSFEETLRTGKTPINLADAALIALALRERRRLTETWDGITAELSIPGNNEHRSLVDLWRTPLACLYGMIPDPGDFLRALNAGNSLEIGEIIDICLHITACQPVDDDIRAAQLLPLITPSPKSIQVAWLEKIIATGAEDLASLIAIELLQTNIASQAQSIRFSADDFEDAGSPVEFSHHMKAMEELRQFAEIYRLAGHPEKSLQLMQEVGEGLRCIYSRILSGAAVSAHSAGDSHSARMYRQKSLDLAPELKPNRAELADDLGKSGDIQKAFEVLSSGPAGLAGLITTTILACAAGENDQARQAAISADDEIQKGNLGLAPLQVLKDITSYIDCLLKLGLAEVASRTAQAALKFRQQDPELLLKLSQANIACSRKAEACDTAHLAVSLQPSNLTFRRSLAETHERNGDWGQAYEERKAVLEYSPQNDNEDLLSMAHSALQAGDVEKAVETCGGILEHEPENGSAHAIYALSLRQQGKIPEAYEHFRQAVALAPELPDAWLALAEMQEDQGQSIQALETLRSGALSAPNSAKIQHALAETCLQNGSPSEALPALRKAAHLDPDSASIAIRLGDILRSLGHLDESSAVLKRAMHNSPKDAELAYELAKTSITAGDNESAIKALETRLNALPNDIEAGVLYSRLLLETCNQFPDSIEASCRLGKAESTLGNILSIQPDHMEAGVLLAEVLTASGRTQEALDQYQYLTGKYEDQSQAWSWRIKLGLGKAALDLDKMDIALAAMKEAAQLNPESIQVEKTLAETYLAGNMLQEAMQAGDTVIKSSPEDPSIRMWFASLALSCGNLNAAIASLEKAADQSGSSAEPALRLAQVELLANNPPAARSALSGILHNVSIGPDDLEPTAYLYIQAGDNEAAEECLVKACELGAGSGCWYGLSRIQMESGKDEAALTTIQEAIARYPNDPRLHLLQADLFALAGRYQEGLDSLARIDRKNIGTEMKATSKKSGFPPIQPPAMFGACLEEGAILEKEAHLMRRKGDIKAALDKVLQALELDPDILSTRNLAISLAHAMLDLNLAYSLSPEVSTSGSKLNRRIDPNLAADLLCARAEVEIDLDKAGDAYTTLARAEELAPSYPRTTANLAYLAATHGDFLEGEKLLEAAIQRLDSRSQSYASGSPMVAHSDLEYPAFSIIQAAAALYQWGLAFPLIDQAVRSAPAEARVHLAAARTAVLAQEAARISGILDIANHQPAIDLNSESNYQIYENEIRSISHLCSSPLLDRWMARGQAVFASSEDSSIFVGLATSPHDRQAYLWKLYEEDATGDLIQAGQSCQDDPDSLLPFALGLVHCQPEQSLAAAKVMAGISANHPVHQAALAVIASQVDDDVEALQAIEQALQIWPDEPHWHSLAARLSASCGDMAGQLLHLEQTHHLLPEDTNQMIALGEAYLENNDTIRGMEMLESAVSQDTASHEAWLALAKACMICGDIERATTCAEKSALLAPERPEPRLISGQIALQSGQVSEARQHAEAVLRRDGSETQAVMILVRSFLAEGRPNEALSLIDKSITSVRDPFSLKLEQAKLLVQVSGIESAIHALQHLAIDYPREVTVHRELAQLLALGGNYTEAEQAAHSALQLQPYQPELHLLVGSLQRASGQLDQAIYHLSEAVHQAPGYVDGYLELGRAFQDRGEYPQAMDVIQQAMAAAPGDPRPYALAAAGLKDAKDYVRAESYLRKAANLAPEDVSIRRQLGAMIALNLVHNPVEAVH